MKPFFSGVKVGNSQQAACYNPKKWKNALEESEETTNPEAAKGRLVSRQAVLTARRGNFSKVDINLEPGAALEVSVKQLDEKGTPLSLERKRFENELPIKEQVTTTPLIKEGVNTKVLSKINHKTWLFLAALAVYLLTRFIGLDSYPIYFFTDEAVQTVLAADLVQNDFRDYQDELLPTYFKNGGQYNLGTSVYFQVVPWLLFGKSSWVTRGTSVVISLLAAICAGLILKNIFKVEYAFAGILLLSSTPAWFLHSRTAFETVTAVAFYAAFLYAYLRYRQGNPKALPLAVLFGAICFYSYSPAQMVVAVTALLFLILDFRTHLHNKKIVLLSVVIAAVMAIPYVRFLILHPDENRRHLEILNSYLIKDISLFEKANIFFSEYFKMINPLYWFAPNPAEIERHLMKGYGHLPIWSAPFFFLGLWRLIKNLRQSENRSVFIALLTAPAGAALAGAAITRSLFLVVPAVLVTAIGLEEVLGSLKKCKLSSIFVSLVLFAGLSAVNFFMLRDVLVNDPCGFPIIHLAGSNMAGPVQVFSEIKNLAGRRCGQDDLPVTIVGQTN
jgi:4-amino-4-deoxy-L-arabinose transferase-like glycosyltransferase